MSKALWTAVAVISFGCGDGSNHPLAPESDNVFDATRGRPYPARVNLGTLGGDVSYAFDVNTAGFVVGSATNRAGQTRAFRWTLSGGMVDLGALPGDAESRAMDINDDGTILGQSVRRYGSDSAIARAVTWDAAGTIRPLVLPFAVPSGYGGVTLVALPNAQGQWAANAHVLDGLENDDAALFFSNATGVINLRTLGRRSGLDPLITFGIYATNYAVGINARGTILGQGGDRDRPRIFLWNPADGFQLPGAPPNSYLPGTRVTALGLNDFDEVAGSFASERWDGNVRTFTGGAYRWSAKKGFEVLVGDEGAYASDINDRGEAVGVVWLNTAAAAAWPRSGGIKLLPTDPGESTFAFEINNQGLVVGWGSSSSGVENHAILWNAALVRKEKGSKGPERHASGFEDKVRRCLFSPGGKTVRAICISS